MKSLEFAWTRKLKSAGESDGGETGGPWGSGLTGEELGSPADPPGVIAGCCIGAAGDDGVTIGAIGVDVMSQPSAPRSGRRPDARTSNEKMGLEVGVVQIPGLQVRKKSYRDVSTVERMGLVTLPWSQVTTNI